MASAIERGDVRLYRFPKPDKERPVVVLTRSSSLRHLSTATIAPITSAIRGIASEVALDESDGMKSACCINLHNTVTVPQHKIGKRVATLSARRMDQLCDAIRFALGCE